MVFFIRMTSNLDLGFFARPVSTVKGWIVVSFTWKEAHTVENWLTIPDNKYWKEWNHVPLNQGCLPSAQDRGPPSCLSEQTRKLSLSIFLKVKFVIKGTTSKKPLTHSRAQGLEFLSPRPCLTCSLCDPVVIRWLMYQCYIHHDERIFTMFSVSIRGKNS